MLVKIRNYFAAFAVISLCVLGLMGPFFFPEIYQQQLMNSSPYGIPMVQHHVEICDQKRSIKTNECKDSTIFIV